ncbi:facilitated trehalose transporter Tret1-2 homolog [Anticarsia gemmatalis]|uniref:facilitated trehalose transporter Tret1-2 homolog n=1 Tax=Anticarsia gemmatalis TaxID=129554 RepID=UPI003F77116E
MEEIEDYDRLEKYNGWQKRKFFFRQLLISTGAWTCYFIMGISFGASTVFIPQIRAEANSTKAVSEEVASWIPAILVYSGLPWSFILPVVMKIYGRKYTFTFVCISNLISFIVLYCSTTITQIIISELINGINTGGHFTVSVMIITEYTSPKYRGFFLTAKSATLFWGILVSNAIGTFFHWKNIALVGIACSIYSIAIAFILPESPYWLTTKHRFDKCSKSHRWLKGSDVQSEKDLDQLILFQKNVESNKNANFELKEFVMKNINVMSSRQFYKPLILSILVQSLYVFSGKVVFSVYAIDIIRKITKDQHISAYTAMLILDGVTVFCMYIGCVFAKMLTRRKLLITTSLFGIVFLVAISVYSYLIKLGVLQENNYVSIGLMIGYSVGIACGPIILSQAISGELVSIESRGLSSCCIDLCLKINLGTLVKISPLIFKSWGTEGAFLFYGVTSSMFLFLIYKYLPETKDKTLQEIAECMKGKSKRKVCVEEDAFLAHNNKAVN